MKTEQQIKGKNASLKINIIVNTDWKSDFQEVDSENDDGIDAIIHIRKDGEKTGEIIYAQIKAGNGYIASSKNRPDYIGINVGEDYITKHRPRWNSLMGAVILIFMDDDHKAYWTDLKDENSYTTDNKSIILIPSKQRFGAHSKGHFKKIGNVFPQDNRLLDIKIRSSDIAYLRIDKPLKQSARDFYKQWSNSKIEERTNPGLGEIIVNRSGWRHISRIKRGYDKIFQSWQLLSIAKKIIQTVDKAYQITKRESVSEDETQYILKDYLSLRAKIIFPNRSSSVVQVVLKRKKIVNKRNHDINQKIWFFSIYEPRRGF
jgi:hypothetical protein